MEIKEAKNNFYDLVFLFLAFISYKKFYYFV